MAGHPASRVSDLCLLDAWPRPYDVRRQVLNADLRAGQEAQRDGDSTSALLHREASRGIHIQARRRLNCAEGNSTVVIAFICRSTGDGDPKQRDRPYQSTGASLFLGQMQSYSMKRGGNVLLINYIEQKNCSSVDRSTEIY
jgi:hypothetical protein